MTRRMPQRRASSIPFASVVAVCLVVAWITLLGVSPAQAAAPRHAKGHDSKQQVEQLEEQWRLAQLNGDVAAMDKLLSDDYIGISLNGQVNTKAQQLERTRTQRVAITRIDLSDMKVKFIGSIAIVTSRADIEGTSDSASIKGVYRYTRVYQRLSSGAWKITSFEATRTPQSRRQQGDSGGPSNDKNDKADHPA
jgi:ketosteroid isomerase-like protein